MVTFSRLLRNCLEVCLYFSGLKSGLQRFNYYLKWLVALLHLCKLVLNTILTYWKLFTSHELALYSNGQIPPSLPFQWKQLVPLNYTQNPLLCWAAPTFALVIRKKLPLDGQLGRLPVPVCLCMCVSPFFFADLLICSWEKSLLFAYILKEKRWSGLIFE